MTTDNTLVAVRELTVSFEAEHNAITAIDRVSLVIPRSRIVALVGESGCGKSVTALSMMRLLPEPPSRVDHGRILYHPTSDKHPIDLLTIPERGMGKIRGRDMAMIFQDSLTSLNPVYTVGEQIIEVIQLHQSLARKAAREQAIALLRRVGIEAPATRIDAYPHELSGGMRQRVMIAMAVSCNPSLLIADEPTTALDVTIQKKILDLLRDLQRESGMSILLITHDFGVVSAVADEVYVMYAGRIVEHATTKELFSNPMHPYTQGLLESTPRLGAGRKRLVAIEGQVPDPSHYPSGCRFHPRCRRSFAQAEKSNRANLTIDSALGSRLLRRCVEEFDGEPSGAPPLCEVSPEHHVACWEVEQ